MRRLTTVNDLESVVGTQPQAMMMKAIDSLDEGSVRVIAVSPVAGFGFRDDTGTPWSTIAGGSPGFARVMSPTRVDFEIPRDRPTPALGTAVSLVFLLPGIGETLRLTGAAAELAGRVITVDLHEAWVHCAKCIHRSGLWDPHPNGNDADTQPPLTPVSVSTDSPFGSSAMRDFLARARFAMVTSWDRTARSDTSPRGDRAGFIRILDDRTLALPDRKGNRRTDTFHNLLECDDIALGVVVPGHDDVLHLRGSAYVTDDVGLRASMALSERPPHAALIIEVGGAELHRNEAISNGQMWDQSTHVDRSTVPDLMALGAEHLARSKEKGATASMTRIVSKRLANNPGFLRKGVDRGYRKELEEEGF
jgi:predicted pyridoxine 5'-phosphate oxidase superfamily flavin-nucleotide-binding protein